MQENKMHEPDKIHLRYKIAFPSIAIILAIVVYWYWANIWKREIHWKPGPEVAFTPKDLTKVYWEDPEIQKRNPSVIAGNGQGMRVPGFVWPVFEVLR